MGFHKLVWAGLLLACSVAATDYENHPSVQLFREYLRINTTTYSDLTPAVEFWTDLANRLDLPVQVVEFHPGMPVIIITWPGTDDSLPRIMLNSHIDVVPADEPTWTYPPFAGHMTEEGDIYGRGTQDMKSVSIQYYEALYRITQVNKMKLRRTIYMTLMPDEEVGGFFGMQALVNSELFQTMNVECEMDEGGPFPMPFSAVFYQDKTPWHVQIDCYGQGGHGSTFPPARETASGQCKYIMDELLNYRAQQFEVAIRAAINNAGVFTSINLNRLDGGTASNIIPSHVRLVFDIRLAVTIHEDVFEGMLNQWVAQAGDNVEITYLLKDRQSPPTILDDSNPYWVAIEAAATEMQLPLLPTIPPGSTDARHIRSETISAFGFSPMPNTDLLLHMVDERVNAATFLRGIDIYEKIITNLGNLP